jgi:hypothetical protein
VASWSGFWRGVVRFVLIINLMFLFNDFCSYLQHGLHKVQVPFYFIYQVINYPFIVLTLNLAFNFIYLFIYLLYIGYVASYLVMPF